MNQPFSATLHTYLSNEPLTRSLSPFMGCCIFQQKVELMDCHSLQDGHTSGWITSLINNAWWSIQLSIPT